MTEAMNDSPADRQPPRPFGLVAVLLLLVWVALSIAFYYVTHKPWGTGQPAALAAALADVLLAGGLIGFAGGFGSLLLKHFLPTAKLERPVLALALGIGAGSLTLLLVGLSGLYTTWLAYLALLVGILLLRRHILAWLGEMAAIVKAGSQWSGLERVTFVFVVCLLAFNLLRALAPPVKWDSLVYHLELPRLYLERGRLYFTPENFYGGFPQVAELWFVWGMALRAGSTAVVYSWAVGATAFIGVEVLARRISASIPRWLAPAVLLSGFSFSHSLSWAYVDLFVMLFGVCLWLSLLNYVENNRRSDLFLMGIMAGLAIGAKYTSAVLLPLVGLALLYDAVVRRSSMRKLVVEALWLTAVVTIMIVPWIAKNWILAGNPAYPFISFDKTVDPWQHTFRSGPPPQRNLLDDLILPVDATLSGIENAIVVGRPEYGASLGPLMLALIPGLLIGWKNYSVEERRKLKLMLAAAGGTWLVWAAASHFADELMRPRHYFGVFPVLAALAATGFQAAAGVSLPGVRLGRVLAVLTSFALLLSGLAEVDYLTTNNPLPVILGRQSQADFLRQELGVYADAMEAVNRLPDGSVVLFLWEPKVYYCMQECISDGKIDNWWALLQAGGDSVGVTRLLEERGVTHVLIYDGGLNLLTQSGELAQDEWQALQAFRAERLALVETIDNYYSLYALH